MAVCEECEGSDFMPADDSGQMACTNCGTLRHETVIDFQPNFGEHGAALVPLGEGDKCSFTVDCACTRHAKVDARVQGICRALRFDDTSAEKAQRLTRIALGGRPRSGAPLESIAACCVLLTTRSEASGSVLTLREVAAHVNCQEKAVNKEWMRLMARIKKDLQEETHSNALVAAGSTSTGNRLDPTSLLDQKLQMLQARLTSEDMYALVPADGPGYTPASASRPTNSREALAAAARALGRDGDARALAKGLLEIASQEWAALMEGRAPAQLVAAVIILTCKTDPCLKAVKAAPFVPEKTMVERVLEVLNLPLQYSGTVRLRVNEIKAVTLSLAKQLPGRQKHSDALLLRALPELVAELIMQRETEMRLAEEEEEEEEAEEEAEEEGEGEGDDAAAAQEVQALQPPALALVLAHAPPGGSRATTDAASVPAPAPRRQASLGLQVARELSDAVAADTAAAGPSQLPSDPRPVVATTTAAVIAAAAAASTPGPSGSFAPPAFAASAARRQQRQRQLDGARERIRSGTAGGAAACSREDLQMEEALRRGVPVEALLGGYFKSTPAHADREVDEASAPHLFSSELGDADLAADEVRHHVMGSSQNDREVVAARSRLLRDSEVAVKRQRLTMAAPSAAAERAGKGALVLEKMKKEMAEDGEDDDDDDDDDDDGEEEEDEDDEEELEEYQE